MRRRDRSLRAVRASADSTPVDPGLVRPDAPDAETAGLCAPSGTGRAAWHVALGFVVLTASRAVAQAPAYEVTAVRYAVLPAFPVSQLVAGADTSRRQDIAMMVWVIQGGRKLILVDAGFYRKKFLDRWKPVDFSTPAEAIARAGFRPAEVTDIILSHVHWDHMDGIDLFPRAREWIQQQEFDYHTDATGRVKNRSIDPDDAAVLGQFRATGRVTLVAGDAKEIIPGITVYTGGKHTWASQYVGVATRAGTVVLASDNVYLYENLDQRRPIAQTLDSVSNLAAQERMRTIASDARLIIPGHDPLVFERFPTPGNGVARIE